MQHNDARRAAEERAGEFPNDRRSQARPKPPVDFEGDETAPRAVEAVRLRRVVRALGLDDSVPEDDGQLRDALFAVLGIIARRVEQTHAADEWRVGEYWSSANPGKRVLMLEVGAAEIEKNGRHPDFIRWVGGSVLNATDLQARLERAERALVRSGFEDLGGQEWKPPLGKEPLGMVVSQGGGDLRVSWLHPDRCRVGMYLYDGAFHGQPALVRDLTPEQVEQFKDAWSKLAPPGVTDSEGGHHD